MGVRACPVLSRSHPEGCLACPSGRVLHQRQQNTTVSSYAVSGPCLVVFAEVSPLLLLNGINMRDNPFDTIPERSDMSPGPTTVLSGQPPPALPPLSTRQCRKMPGKAIMRSAFPPIWLKQVVGGNVPNYKAGWEPPGEFPALPLAWRPLCKYSVALSINLNSSCFWREAFK